MVIQWPESVTSCAPGGCAPELCPQWLELLLGVILLRYNLWPEELLARTGHALMQIHGRWQCRKCFQGSSPSGLLAWLRHHAECTPITSPQGARPRREHSQEEVMLRATQIHEMYQLTDVHWLLSCLPPSIRLRGPEITSLSEFSTALANAVQLQPILYNSCRFLAIPADSPQLWHLSWPFSDSPRHFLSNDPKFHAKWRRKSPNQEDPAFSALEGPVLAPPVASFGLPTRFRAERSKFHAKWILIDAGS